MLNMDDKNRPESVDPSLNRLNLECIADYKLIEKWVCEFRYSPQDFRAMKAGDLKKAHVSKDVAKKILKAAESIPGFRLD